MRHAYLAQPTRPRSVAPQLTESRCVLVTASQENIRQTNMKGFGQHFRRKKPRNETAEAGASTDGLPGERNTSTPEPNVATAVTRSAQQLQESSQIEGSDSPQKDPPLYFSRCARFSLFTNDAQDHRSR